MTATKNFVLRLTKSTRIDPEPLSNAIDTLRDLLYRQNRNIYDVYVTKDIYPEVAKQLGMNIPAVSRSIVRAAHRCFSQLSSEQINAIIGRPIPYLDSPSDMIFYLAAYLETGQPYYADSKYPALLL